MKPINHVNITIPAGANILPSRELVAGFWNIIYITNPTNRIVNNHTDNWVTPNINPIRNAGNPQDKGEFMIFKMFFIIDKS